MIRIILSLLFLTLGLWLFHQTSVYQGVVSARGMGRLEDLLADAPFLLRFMGALGLILGGAVGLRMKWGGVILSGLGVIFYIVLFVALLVLGAHVSMWREEAIWAGSLLAIWLAFLIFARHPRTL